MTLEIRATRQYYRSLFDAKWSVKNNPLARRLRPLTPAFLDAITQAEDHPPVVRANTRTPVPQPSSGSPQ
jgi:hypothetical protein